MMYPLYVVSNGDFFREALNATVTLLGTDTYGSALFIASMLAVVMTTFQYIKTKDLMELAKFFGLYMVVTTVFLVPRVDMQIIDVSDPGRADLTVDNVPVGMALPAYMITAISHGLTQTMDAIFAMPREASYSQTGMLFGSKLFRLGTGMQLDATTQKLANDYIKSCVIGDILINHKYSVTDLKNSTDIFGLITGQASPVRGLYIDGVYHTCRDAVPILKSKLKKAQDGAFIRFSKKLNMPAASLKPLFVNSTNYFTNLSQTSTQILNQNLWINATKKGMANYIASTNNTAALINYQDTSNMLKMRLSWSALGSMALYTLPLMQVVLLAVMLCLFPIVLMLFLLPNLGPKVFSNWVYSIAWVSVWPILFAIFNLAMNYYLYNSTFGMSDGGLTLSNSNPAAQEHSDIGGIAGYLALSIPYISIGIVKGMAGAFNVASNYIGGMAHSFAQGTAQSVESGNFSLGNTSYANATANNLSMNKHDSNYTNMHGMMTEQLATGATVSHTPGGQDVYNVSPAMSNLAVTARLGQMVSSQLSHSASESLANVKHDQTSLGQSVSSLASTAENLSHTQSATNSYGEGANTGMSTQQSEAFHRADSIVSNWAKEHGHTHSDAWRGFLSASLEGSAGGNLGFASGYVKGAAGGDKSWSGDTRDSNTDRISSQEQQQFNHDMQIAASAAHNTHTESGHSDANSLGAQLSAQYNQMQQQAHTLSSDQSKAENLQNMANYAASHSASIDANYSQEFVNFAQEHLGYRAQGVLSNPNTDTSMELLKNTAEQFVAQKLKPAIAQDYEAFKSSVNPEAEHASQVQHMQPNSVQQDYAKQSAGVRHSGQVAHYDAAKAQAISKQADKALDNNQYQTTMGGKNALNASHQNKTDVKQALSEKDEKSLSELRKEAGQKKVNDGNAMKKDEGWPGWT